MPSPKSPWMWGVGFLRRGTALLLAGVLACAAVGWQAKPALADENKILTITKYALYGGATGLLLGGVSALVVDKHDRGDVIRWGIVIGVFGGFAYGVYDATHGSGEFSQLVPPPPATLGAGPNAELILGGGTPPGWRVDGEPSLLPVRLPGPPAPILGRPGPGLAADLEFAQSVPSIPPPRADLGRNSW